MSIRYALIAILLVFSSIVGVSARDLPEGPAWAAPPIERAVTVLDGRTGEIMSFATMLDALAQADAVFLGETHVDETTHRVELAVYEGLLERGDVVLALEMFERDVQATLDQYLAGEIDEDEFLEPARPWDNYRSAYRPLIERARAGALPVIASNFPRPLRRRVAAEGLSVLAELEGDERSHAPAELFPNTARYWRRVDNAVRGHIAMMRGNDKDDRLSSTQTLWDNSMGEACALALDAHPGSMVLHVNGGFHSAYWGGTVRQFKLRKPEASVLTVSIRSTRNPAVAEIGGEPVADFVVMAEDRATDRNQGSWSVALNRTLKYRLHLPPDASETHPVPLLIWLGDDGLSAVDGLDLWRQRLGDEAAIAVVEPPYRALLEDKSEGGRWFWANSFASDASSIVSATERIWGYILRNYPIDPLRVSVAGEGSGATLVSAIALLGRRMDHAAVALAPRQYAQLRDFPLPLPEYNPDSQRQVTLRVVADEEDAEWWGNEFDAYAEIGLDATFVTAAGDPSQRDTRQEAALREALGLPPAPGSEALSPAHMRVPADTPRAWHWSRLYALRHRAKTGQHVTLVAPDAPNAPATESLTVIIDPATSGDALPRCPGPFGGTTVLVLPEDVAAADREAWIALEKNDPLTKESRFHRLRIVRSDADAGERALGPMLTKLEQEGRANVLIVPATFCASAQTMRDLERQTQGASNRMTLRWLPGLGGEALAERR